MTAERKVSGRCLPSKKLQGMRKVRPDLPVGLILEKLRAGGDKSLHHPHAVLADTAVGGRYHIGLS